MGERTIPELVYLPTGMGACCPVLHNGASMVGDISLREKQRHSGCFARNECRKFDMSISLREVNIEKAWLYLKLDLPGATFLFLFGEKVRLNRPD